jgi:SAM-dependent methyltransferase
MAQRCSFCGGPADFYASATDTDYFTTPDRFEFHHCVTCDILFIVPMLTDRLDVIYPSNYYAFADSGPKTFVVRVKEWLDARLLRRILKDIPGQTIRVLDIGGGTGWLADLVRRIDPRVSVTQIVDLDSRAQARAEASGHRYFRGRIEDFKADTPFDLVLMLNLIEHVARPDQVLRQMRNILTEHGRILIKTPNYRSLDAVLFRHQGWGGYHCPRHFVIFSRQGLERMLHSAGLQIERFAYTQGAPFWSASIMNMLRRRGIIRINAERTYDQHPLLDYLQVVTAAFDFVRKPFARLSQMIVVARRIDQAGQL